MRENVSYQHLSPWAVPLVFVWCNALNKLTENVNEKKIRAFSQWNPVVFKTILIAHNSAELMQFLLWLSLIKNSVLTKTEKLLKIA